MSLVSKMLELVCQGEQPWARLTQFGCYRRLGERVSGLVKFRGRGMLWLCDAKMTLTGIIHACTSFIAIDIQTGLRSRGQDRIHVTMTLQL